MGLMSANDWLKRPPFAKDRNATGFGMYRLAASSTACGCQAVHRS
jgi:hypothetical protein